MKSAEKYASRSARVATVERELLTLVRRSTAMPAATGSSLSIGGRSSRSRNCRAYGLKLSTKRRWPSAYSVSTARLLLPLPETPVTAVSSTCGQVDADARQVVGAGALETDALHGAEQAVLTGGPRSFTPREAHSATEQASQSALPPVKTAASPSHLARFQPTGAPGRSRADNPGRPTRALAESATSVRRDWSVRRLGRHCTPRVGWSRRNRLCGARPHARHWPSTTRRCCAPARSPPSSAGGRAASTGTRPPRRSASFTRPPE